MPSSFDLMGQAGGINRNPKAYTPGTPAQFPETAPQTGLPTDPAEAFNQTNQLPWLGDMLLNKQDYQTPIPQELQQQAEQGYGYQWMSDVFANYLSQNGRDYAKALDITNLNAIRSGFDDSGVANQAAQDVQYQYGQGAVNAYGQAYAQNESQKLAASGQVQNIELANLQSGQNVELLNDQYRRAIESATAQGTAGMADWLSNWNQDVSAIKNQQTQFEWGTQQQKLAFEQQFKLMEQSLSANREANQPKSSWMDYVGIGLQGAALIA